ncbi:hypothetical protein Ana3638_04320 [Anaerocolumna sedimenticola]|uniref:Uncharacterized protein n=1 Tax=Anaerocolumna sedimenticola TaxID=2696063 RepID=A0A6P1TKD5_9FIRM|nr:hypothetical protein [Anaerocolumna sedimenticola]QHQ60105.1 hypothetical protein Ana3638_04320 [Anaerocolumna sedimenticola]
MYDYEMMSGKLRMYMKDAVSNLKNNEYEESYKLIMKAINIDPNAAEPHNLLGIWYEFKGENDLARKHYRISYVLNPTYKPASVNLERVSTLFPYKNIEVDFGDVNTDISNQGTKETHLKEAN